MVLRNIDIQLYSTSWALFTFLINEHRNELRRDVELLSAPAVAGGAVEPS